MSEAPSAIPIKEQEQIDGYKKLMLPENADLFQRTCERVYSGQGTDQEKAKEILPSWLFCLGFGPDILNEPNLIKKTTKSLQAIRQLFERGKKNGASLKFLNELKGRLRSVLKGKGGRF